MGKMTPPIVSQIQLPDGTSYEQPIGLFINGEFKAARSQTTFDTIDPYTGKVICSVARGESSDIDAAVSAAQSAFQGWKDTPSQQRGRLLDKLAELMERDADLLAKIEVRYTKIPETSLSYEEGEIEDS